MPAIGGHTRPNQGRSVDWITPYEILTTLGDFALDPCACDPQPWRTAKTMWTFRDNGLGKKWFGRVWLNPPYGRETGGWLRRLAEHGNGIALIFARTETKMFHRWVWGKASALLFIKGRLYFYYPNGERSKINAGGPSVLIAYGAQNAEWLKLSNIEGAFVQEVER